MEFLLILHLPGDVLGITHLAFKDRAEKTLPEVLPKQKRHDRRKVNKGKQFLR